MIRRKLITLTILIVSMVAVQNAASQFPIKLPKVGKPKVDKPQPDDPSSSGQKPTVTNPANSDKNSRKKIYEFEMPPAKPMFLKETLYIEAAIHKGYWKVPADAKHSSWVPRISFDTYESKDGETIQYAVDYFNTDGSLWFSEDLEAGFRAANYTVSRRSDRFFTSQTAEKKATSTTGVFGVKIRNKATAETVFQGKFKVGKFMPENRAKNEFEFFVDHDWLLPYGYVGFHHSAFANDGGGVPVEISIWTKGNFDLNELEARAFFQGKQIASTKEKNGGGVTDEMKRAVEFAVYTPETHIWQERRFALGNLRYDNGGGYNPDNYPGSHYADKNPGEYTIKIYNAGTEIRELKFTVGNDGKLVDGGFAKQMFLPNYKVLVPAKNFPSKENWTPQVSKTESFYGNPLTGFQTP